MSMTSDVKTPTTDCPLCGRTLGLVNVDKHHLTPKSQGGHDKFLIHRICHRKIHATFTEKELARSYNTWESLKAHEMIRAFVEWVAKKPPEFYDGSVSSKRKR